MFMTSQLLDRSHFLTCLRASGAGLGRARHPEQWKGAAAGSVRRLLNPTTPKPPTLSDAWCWQSLLTMHWRGCNGCNGCNTVAGRYLEWMSTTVMMILTIHASGNSQNKTLGMVVAVECAV
jgi:hypothetical protein